MPQPRKIPSTKARRSAVNTQIETAEVDPKELAKLEKSINSRDQAPTVAQSTPTNDDWKRFSTTLANPFDKDRAPTLAQLRQIRKDPMIAFGLHYIKVPIGRANWVINARDKNGPNAQVAAFIDAAMRKIYARYVFQRTQALDFGFKAQVKRFILENPGGIYKESAAKESDPEKRIKPVWDEGNILPYIWKTPVGLKPELVTPRFVETGVREGEFDGILYEVPANQRTKAQGFASKNSKDAAGKVIDVYHSLWGTNMKDEEDGSIYGYPRIAFAKDYWWDYTFARGMANRGYERIAIPPIIARYPIGNTDMGEGILRPNWEIALEAAERLRSNSVAAVPSTMQEAGLDGISNHPAWDFKFLETPTDALSAFDSRFNYLNVMKLRSLWVPEQAFIEGAGGQSSRNVASQMAQIFEASQQLLMEEIAAEINQYMIPQLLYLNFPEFLNNGGSAKMISHGFRSEDLDFYKQVIQLIGQADPELMGRIDTAELFDRVNVPLKDARDYDIEQSELAEQLALEGPPLVTPTPTSVGTISNPAVAPGSTNGGSVPEPNPAGTVVAGFSQNALPYIYVQPQETYSPAMMFADSETDNFLASLPSSKHYSDKTLRSLTLQMRKLWYNHFNTLYPELAGHVSQIDDFINLADEDGGRIFELADKDNIKKATKAQAEKAAKTILRSFSVSANALSELRKRSAILLKKIADRSAQLDLRRTKNRDVEIEEDSWSDWLDEQTGRLIKFTDNTMRNEVQKFLINNIRDGKTPNEIAGELVEHYKSFPETKASAIARSETRDAVNAGTLISSEASGINYVKGSDGEEFDEDCKERNGTLYTIKEAWKEMRKEHTYGTLGFDPVPRAEFSIQPVSTMPPDAPENAGVFFNNETSTAYVLADVPDEDCKLFLSQLSDWLTNHSNGVEA